MVKITLNNLDPHSPYKEAVIDLSTDRCLMNNQEEVDRLFFLKKIPFNNPLLTHNILSQTEGIYHYTYDDFDGFLQTTKCVYSTLIQAEKPRECIFKITPSTHYMTLKQNYSIPFSIDHSLASNECISVNQLNGLISQLSGFNFNYFDSILLDKTITIKNLPEAIHWEVIYQTNKDVYAFLKRPDCMKKYEWRYINKRIGFGIFARERIESGEIISQYCGTLVTSDIKNKSFCYKTKDNGFELNVDACNYGNISRFINHAPKHHPSAITSNIKQKNCNLFGNNIIIYSAHKTIEKGEQLLTDYGPDYFNKPKTLLLMNKKSRVTDTSNKTVKDSKHQRNHTLYVMKQHGIKQAQRLCLKKQIYVFLFSLCVVLGLKYSVHITQAYPFLNTFPFLQSLRAL